MSISILPIQIGFSRYLNLRLSITLSPNIKFIFVFYTIHNRNKYFVQSFFSHFDNFFCILLVFFFVFFRQNFISVLLYSIFMFMLLSSCAKSFIYLFRACCCSFFCYFHSIILLLLNHLMNANNFLHYLLTFLCLRYQTFFYYSFI